MLERVRNHVGDLKYMTFAQARRMRDFLYEHDLFDVLELGFYHGVSTAYLAEMIRDRGRGHLTTIDLESARALSPNVDDLLAGLGLADLVTVHYEPTSYTWRLMKLIEAHPEPAFDLCYLDGGHSWAVSGFGFFLVEKLLRPGGWIIVDDLDWTYERMLQPDGSRPAFMATMPEDELRTPQIRKVWDLLVTRHPGFDSFREEGQWGFARKAG